jgi:transcriptional regulator with XRE-family HTH domain
MCDMAIINKTAQLPPPVIGNLKELGRRIAVARKIQRLKQENLAGMAGISRSTLTEIEKGSPFVSIGNYMAALWALGLMKDSFATEMTEEEQRLVTTELPKRVRNG